MNEWKVSIMHNTNLKNKIILTQEIIIIILTHFTIMFLNDVDGKL